MIITIDHSMPTIDDLRAFSSRILFLDEDDYDRDKFIKKRRLREVAEADFVIVRSKTSHRLMLTKSRYGRWQAGDLVRRW